jgi:hypothetical protein
VYSFKSLSFIFLNMILAKGFASIMLILIHLLSDVRGILIDACIPIMGYVSTLVTVHFLWY